jgi:glutaredoxin
MKELMERAQTDYNEISYNEMTVLEREEFVATYPQIQSFPVAIIDGQFHGGIVEVAKLFLQKGLVSAPKK